MQLPDRCSFASSQETACNLNNNNNNGTTSDSPIAFRNNPHTDNARSSFISARSDSIITSSSATVHIPLDPTQTSGNSNHHSKNLPFSRKTRIFLSCRLLLCIVLLAYFVTRRTNYQKNDYVDLREQPKDPDEDFFQSLLQDPLNLPTSCKEQKAMIGVHDETCNCQNRVLGRVRFKVSTSNQKLISNDTDQNIKNLLYDISAMRMYANTPDYTYNENTVKLNIGGSLLSPIDVPPGWSMENDIQECTNQHLACVLFRRSSIPSTLLIGGDHHDDDDDTSLGLDELANTSRMEQSLPSMKLIPFGAVTRKPKATVLDHHNPGMGIKLEYYGVVDNGDDRRHPTTMGGSVSRVLTPSTTMMSMAPPFVYVADLSIPQERNVTNSSVNSTTTLVGDSGSIDEEEDDDDADEDDHNEEEDDHNEEEDDEDDDMGVQENLDCGPDGRVVTYNLHCDSRRNTILTSVFLADDGCRLEATFVSKFACALCREECEWD